MPEIEGFILTGGASSRMGIDKSRLRIGEQTFVERIAEALSAVARSASVVSSRHAPEDFGLPIVPDVFQNCGALGGLHAALSRARADWIAVVSCDLPFVSGKLFERLASLASEAHDAVAPVQEDGRAQPLCALYRRGHCLAVAEELLRAGELRPRALLTRVRTFWVTPRMLSDLPRAELFFRNLNTPDDYERALQEL